MTPLSVIICTKNEELFVERCIQSVLWADEVVVLDSGSTDNTVELARNLGAKVYFQEWAGWSKQHNDAIALASHDWVLYLDCDEIVTPELAKSINSVMSEDPDDDDGFSVSRRGDFLGLLLPNVSRPEKVRRFVRIFNRKKSNYDPSMAVHEEVDVPGKRILLNGELLHWRGYVMDEYVTVFNRYATIEAKVLDDEGVKIAGSMILIRPILRFLWLYVWKRECLLGTRGLIHSLLKTTQEYIRYAKLWEMQNAPRTIHPPTDVYAIESPVLRDKSVVP
jgi:(heptosyl)LPS beta-1,4-glucosyltransferase